MNLIEEIKKKVEMEIRPASRGDSYLEAVVAKKDLQALRSILMQYLGPEAKEPGKKATFPKKVQELIDALGGLRLEQSLFYKQEETGILFACLWPWESNPGRITLKLGIHP